MALEGDAAFGFSGMEVETIARHKMDVMIVVMNNSGIYNGGAIDTKSWAGMQGQIVKNETKLDAQRTREGVQAKKGLRSTSLLYEPRYE